MVPTNKYLQWLNSHNADFLLFEVYPLVQSRNRVEKRQITIASRYIGKDFAFADGVACVFVTFAMRQIAGYGI